MVTIVALVFSSLIGITVLFQLALALGAPWGEYAMGGRYPGKWPLKLRVFGIAQILILLFIELIVLIRAGMLLPGYYQISRLASWFIVGFFVLSFGLNVSTPSKGERLLWAPTSLLLLAASLVIAIS